MVIDLSSTTDKLIALGIEACSCGNKAFTLSTVSIILAPACLFNINKTEVLPSLRPAARISSTESTIEAKSDRCTGLPLR